MTSVGTLWRTVRHLKFGQIVGRAVFRLTRPKPQLAPPPVRRLWSGLWTLPAARRPSLVAPQTFRFLGVEGDLAALGWHGSGAEKLWRYNQHYFDDLNAQAASQRRAWHNALVDDWMARNPPGTGEGWEPYPTSLRICNWLKAGASGLMLTPSAWHSLAVQARWLTERLEWHLLGNHLFVNAKALVVAGIAFDGEEAEAWLTQGLAILDVQVREQILEDGGHFERSPMYHVLILEDLLDLINVVRAAQVSGLESYVANWRAAASLMVYWLRVMTHPDGRLSRFNDCAEGVAPPSSEIERYADALGVRCASPEALVGRGVAVSSAACGGGAAVVHLCDSGYVRAAWRNAVALLDIGPVGPDYLPGHAHADTLSFEFSLHKRALIVNGGTSCYGDSERRSKERGTASHSTLQVAQQNSSEVWSGFRVGRRARPMNVSVNTSEVSASHDGYFWLSGRPLHTRTWRFIDEGLEVEDLVSVPNIPAIARYHLAPGVNLTFCTQQVWDVIVNNKRWAQVEILRGRAVVEASSFAPEFGVVLQTECLAVECELGRSLIRWTWEGGHLDESECISYF
jgi:uncharacterized heparinase superfamily protein